MKRWTFVLLAVLAIGLVGGAGYLGMRSVRGKDEPGTTAPSTVEVTRGDVETTVTAPGHLVNSYEVLLAFGVGGKLAQMNVQPGQEVVAGEALAQLDQAPLLGKVSAALADLDAALAGIERLQAGPSAVELAAAKLALVNAEAWQAELKAGPSGAEVAGAAAEVAAARRDLESLRSLPDPNTLAQAQARYDRAKAALQQAQAAYDRVKDRPEVAMLPQSLALQQATIEWEAAQASLDAAQQKATPAMLKAAWARLAAAEAKLDRLQSGPSGAELAEAALQVEVAQARLAQLTAGPSTADLRQAEATVQLAKLALARAQADLEGATLLAPFDGTVLEISATAGEMVAAASGLIRLARSSALEVEATIIEEDLPLVQIGQKVELFFDAQPEAEVQGYVARIVPQRLPGDRPLYPVYIAASDLPHSLFAGMTVDSSIVIDSRQDVLRLPRVLVRARSDGTASVQVWTGSRTEERTIQVGLRGDVYVEILDGLREGEEVVTQ